MAFHFLEEWISARRNFTIRYFGTRALHWSLETSERNWSTRNGIIRNWQREMEMAKKNTRIRLFPLTKNKHTWQFTEFASRSSTRKTRPRPPTSKQRLTGAHEAATTVTNTRSLLIPLLQCRTFFEYNYPKMRVQCGSDRLPFLLDRERHRKRDRKIVSRYPLINIKTPGEECATSSCRRRYLSSGWRGAWSVAKERWKVSCRGEINWRVRSSLNSSADK